MNSTVVAGKFFGRYVAMMVRQRLLLAAVCASLIALTPLPASAGAAAYLKNEDAWFATDEAKRIASNILSYQSDLGGWPKNIDTAAAPFAGDRKEIHPTFDNSATTDELRFLALMALS